MTACGLACELQGAWQGYCAVAAVSMTVQVPVQYCHHPQGLTRRVRQRTNATNLVDINLVHINLVLCINLGLTGQAMPRGVAKEHLPQKVCETCKRPFTWRKVWEKCWDEVSLPIDCLKYSSVSCRALWSAAAVVAAAVKLLQLLLPTVMTLVGLVIPVSNLISTTRHWRGNITCAPSGQSSLGGTGWQLGQDTSCHPDMLNRYGARLLLLHTGQDVQRPLQG
jgi:hypothetical protein